MRPKLSDPLVDHAVKLVENALAILDLRGEAIAAVYLSMALHTLITPSNGTASSKDGAKKMENHKM